jgi:hypothetical protein
MDGDMKGVMDALVAGAAVVVATTVDMDAEEAGATDGGSAATVTAIN